MDVACLGGTLTSVRITSVGQVLAPWLAAKRIARSTPPALLSPGSKGASGWILGLQGTFARDKRLSISMVSSLLNLNSTQELCSLWCIWSTGRGTHRRAGLLHLLTRRLICSFPPFPTFSQAQYKTRQVHQLGQVDHLQVNHLQVDLHQEHRHKVLPRPTTK